MAGLNVILGLLLCSSLVSIVSSGRASISTSAARFPQGQAERLIKALNLLPGLSEGGLNAAASLDGPRLHEREIKLDVQGDSGISPEKLGQYAGYFKLARTHDANMFYFFFESRGNKTDDPVVLWMTGGPGCASELALFYENGPFKIKEDLSLEWNDFGWDKVSSIIFVDQPIGTGFSYSTDVRDLRHDEDGVSEDMYDFFQAFFKAHPQYLKNKFFVTGESYAGHYVPAVTGRLHKAIKNKEGVPINLKGFAIGNGLTQPDIQYEAYADYALDMNLISQYDYNRLSKLYPACATSIKLCGPKGTVTCIAAYLVCQSIFNAILSIAGNVNYYDIRKECQGGLCYDFSRLDVFLNNETTRAALGVGERKFVPCSPLVYEAMIVDWMKNLEKGIPELLEDGIELLVYAGEYDLICNWLGNSRWVTAMDWSGQIEYAKADWKKFEVDGEEAGLTTGYGPLQFLKVHDAGHMVPMDQPKSSLEMLYRWTRGKSLGDKISDVTIIKEIPSKGDRYTKSV
jgi:serine carboxypeptidase-like clade 4